MRVHQSKKLIHVIFIFQINACSPVEAAHTCYNFLDKCENLFVLYVLFIVRQHLRVLLFNSKNHSSSNGNIEIANGSNKLIENTCHQYSPSLFMNDKFSLTRYNNCLSQKNRIKRKKEELKGFKINMI